MIRNPIELDTQIYPGREEWLAARHGIGASEIGCVFGCGFQTRTELWKLKSGQSRTKDLSGSERVEFGNKAEDALRRLFRVMHPEYDLSFQPFTIYRPRGEYSFLFCTPDGELTERETGKRGLYESKTALCLGRKDWEKWEKKLPDRYLYQVSQGMYCGNFEFAVLFALLRDAEGDGSIRAYRIEREWAEPVIENIQAEGKAFWEDVKSGRVPPVKIRF